MLQIVNSIFILIFIAFIIFSNFHDWDQHLIFSFIDYQSLVQHFELPKWSYQHCGGISRIGDPQSLGFSPFFIFVILLGPFWGLKFIYIVYLALGAYFLNHLFSLLSKKDNLKYNDKLFINFNILIFLSSNFFLWHITFGHTNFLNLFLGIGLIYYILIGKNRSLYKTEKIIFFLTAWQYFSAFQYISNVFFLLPLVVSVIPFLRQNQLKSYNFKNLLPLGLALIFSSYKLYHIYSYLSQFKRNIQIHESYTVLQLLEHIFIPTFNYKILTRTEHIKEYGVHEQSVFSLIPYLFIILCLLCYRNKYNLKVIFQKFKFLILFTCLTFILALGEFTHLAPFSLLKELSNNSIRVATRFQFGVLFSISVFNVVIYFKYFSGQFNKKFYVFGISLILLNIYSFSHFLSPQQFEKLSSLEIQKNKMNMIQSENWNLNWPYTISERAQKYYQDSIISNCYNPLPKRESIQREDIERQHFIQKTNLISNECLSNSFLTQNNIYIDHSCPNEICLEIIDINPYQQIPSFYSYQKDNKWCLKRK